MKIFHFLLYFFLSLSLTSQTIGLVDVIDSTYISSALVNIEYLDNQDKYSILSNENGFLKLQSNNPFVIKIRHFYYQDYIDTVFSIKDTLLLSLIPHYSNLSEIVVTDQINNSTVNDAVNHMISISKKEIIQTASNNLAELLSQNSLFDISFDSALGSGISLQGVQGNNINILIDGVPVVGRKGSQIDLGQLNLSNISSVEILKGPGSVAYGTNSTGGVVNLITQKNVLKDNIQLNSYYESIGINQLNINIDKHVKRHNYNLNFGKYNFDGYDSDTLRSKQWDSKSQYFGEINWNIDFDKADIQLKSSLFNEKIINLGNENFAPFNGSANDNHYETYRSLNYIKFNHEDDNHVFKSLFSLSKTIFSKSQYLVDLLNNSSIQTIDFNYNAKDTFKTIYSRLEYNIDNIHYKNQYGIDIYSESVSGSKILNSSAEIYKIALFSKLEFDAIKKIKIQLGVRVPYHSIYDAPVSPSVHLKYKYSDILQFRCSYARGFRAPTIKELFMEFIDFNHYIYGNADLAAEYSHAFQISSSVLAFKDSKLSLRVNVEGFMNFLENKITLIELENSMAPITPWIYYNLSNSKYYGFTMNFNTETTRYGDFKCSWNRYSIESIDIPNKTIRHNFSFDYTYDNLNLDAGFNVNLKLKGKSQYQRLEEDVLVNYTQDSFQILNANIFKEFHAIKLNVGVGVKNLFNIKDIETFSDEINHTSNDQLLSWGRTYYVQIKYRMF
jgi:outer membrane receptor for ferrienterochelin and colicins